MARTICVITPKVKLSPDAPAAGRLAELEECYGIRLEAPETGTLEDFLRGRVGADLQVGHSVTVGPVTLTVRDMIDGRVETVGLSFSSGEAPPPGQ